MGKIKTVAELTPVELFGVQRSVSGLATKAREQLPEGNHQPFDVTVRFLGEVHVGAETQSTTAPGGPVLLALALEAVGEATRKRMIEYVATCVAAAYAAGERVEATGDASELAEELLRRVARPSLRKGAVTGTSTIEVLRRGT